MNSLNLQRWHWIALGVLVLAVFVTAFLYLRVGRKQDKVYEAELSSRIDSLKRIESVLIKVRDSLEVENQRMQEQVVAYRMEADNAVAVARQKQRENNTLIQQNKKKRDENNKRIDNLTDDDLTRDIIADYGNSSEQCCP